MKKVLISLWSLVAIFACAFALTACGEKEHIHTYGMLIAGKPATCVETGIRAHYRCASCGAYFDENKVEKTREELTLAVDSSAHNYGALVARQPATCAATGMQAHYRCADCGAYFDENKGEKTVQALTLAIDPTAHTCGALVARQPATCAATGMMAHYRCVDCGAYLNEEREEVSGQQLVLPVNKGLHELDKNADVCSVCGDPLTAGLQYTLTANDTYSVKKGSATTVTDLIIPAQYNGKPVTEIGDSAFYNCRSLARVLIPETVTRIGAGAFRNCTSLTSVTLPDGVKTIGNEAFYRCTALTDLTIGRGVTEIGSSAFRDCDALVAVTIPDGVKTIGSSAFYGCDLLERVTIGRGATSIGDSAFYGCAALAGVTIGSGVTEIGSGAFRNCTALGTVTIPDGVKTIGSSAFYGCAALENLTIGRGTTAIGDSAFRGCSSLGAVALPDSIKTIGNSAFYGCALLRRVTIGQGATSIGDSAFYGCTALASVNIPAGVRAIGASAFNKTAVYEDPDHWVNDVLYLDHCLIRAKEDLSGAYAIEAGTRLIADSAFYGCEALTAVTIPASVTAIGDHAFYWCLGLLKIEFAGTLDAWKALEKGSGWDSSTGAYTVDCTNGSLTKEGTETQA